MINEAAELNGYYSSDEAAFRKYFPDVDNLPASEVREKKRQIAASRCRELERRNATLRTSNNTMNRTIERLEKKLNKYKYDNNRLIEENAALQRAKTLLLSQRAELQERLEKQPVRVVREYAERPAQQAPQLPRWMRQGRF